MQIVQPTYAPGLVTFVPRGLISRELIVSTVREHYPSLGDRRVLWDFSQCIVTQLTPADFDAIASAALGALPPATHRKIAYVVADQTSYLAACKYLNSAVAARLPAEYAVFTTVSAALDWLRNDRV